jgi:hypothetical protein
MPRNTFYLEAPDRTQDLLNIKWTLRAAGYAIGSTWHEDQATTSGLSFRDHWNARGMEQLQICDSLVVVCGRGGEAAIELTATAAFALARGLRVIWIGSPLRIISAFRAVEQFRTAEDFRKHIVEEMRLQQTCLRDQLLAA